VPLVVDEAPHDDGRVHRSCSKRGIAMPSQESGIASRVRPILPQSRPVARRRAPPQGEKATRGGHEKSDVVLHN